MEKNTVDVLVKKAKKNDIVAKKALIECFKPLIFKVARKYTYNQFDLEDAYQDGYLLLLKAIKVFDASKGISFQSFLNHNLHYFFIDRLRQQNHSVSTYYNPGDSATKYSENPETLYLKVEETRKQRQKLRTAYQNLTLLQKRIILKRFVEEKTFVQISQEIGNSEASCRNICQYALKKLRRACCPAN